MRNEVDLRQFNASLGRHLESKCECPAIGNPPARVFGITGASCSCRSTYEFETRAYEACIPRDFWYLTESDVTHNDETFFSRIKPYAEKLNTALRNGFGLFLEGGNGAGKSFFLSWVLCEVIRNRPFSVYYTTMMRLDQDTKVGFSNIEYSARLKQALGRDFVVIDELGKEKLKAGDDHMRRALELVLRERFDDSMPTLLASNLSLDAIAKEPDKGGYGPTIKSLIDGKYEALVLESGDHRRKLSEKMKGMWTRD